MYSIFLYLLEQYSLLEYVSLLLAICLPVCLPSFIITKKIVCILTYACLRFLVDNDANVRSCFLPIAVVSDMQDFEKSYNFHWGCIVFAIEVPLHWRTFLWHVFSFHYSPTLRPISIQPFQHSPTFTQTNFKTALLFDKSIPIESYSSTYSKTAHLFDRPIQRHFYS